MITDPILLNILKQSYTLKHIYLQVASRWLQDRIPATKCTILLKGFHNLMSLEMYHFFYEEKNQILGDLVSALGDSPRLQTLGLGLACNFNSTMHPKVMVVEDELDFLEDLCIEYGSRKSYSPLPLRTLKLGHGMFILKKSLTVNATVENFLAKLVKIIDLRTFHIFNGLFMMDIAEETIEYPVVEWSFFSECRSLHQLSVTRLGSDVREWLNAGGRSVQELIVTNRYVPWDAELNNFNLLDLPHLSMLYTGEVILFESHPNDSSSDVASIWSQDSFGSDIDLRSQSSGGRLANLELESQALTEAVPDLITNTVLDRLHDGGLELSRLYVDLNFETQWVGKFSLFLPLFTPLTDAIRSVFPLTCLSYAFSISCA
jgi:hypothetical protein